MIKIKEHCNKTELCICKDCLKKFEDSVNNMNEETKTLCQEIDSAINGIYKDNKMG